MSDLSRNLQAALELIRADATDGECRAPLGKLGAQLGVSARTMRRYVIRLEELGYLRIQRLPGQPSVYRLTAKGQRRWKFGFRIWNFGLGIGPFRNPQSETCPEPSRRACPEPSRRIHNPQSQTETPPIVTVGREEIFAALQVSVAKKRPALLVGPPGIGKSHILRQFASDLGQRSRGAGEPGSRDAEEPGSGNPQPAPSAKRIEGPEIRNVALSSSKGPKCLYLERTTPIKLALLNLARFLHQDGILEVEGIEAGYMDWEDVARKLTRLRINELIGVVTESMGDRDYVLILDHLEAVTPTMLPQVDALMGVALVIGATDELKDSLWRLWWAFERIEVPPLSREQARELLWQVADRNKIENPQLFETRVLQQAGGNPLAIITMATKARTAELSAQEIRGLQHGAGTRYVPLTPVLLLVGALIVAARFVALGLDDRDMYILAGFGYAFFFFLRYFIYRAD